MERSTSTTPRGSALKLYHSRAEEGLAGWGGVEVVPLVGEGEPRRVVPGGWMGRVLAQERGGLDRRVAHEPGSSPEELAVEGPGVLGVGRRVDAHPTAPLADVGPESRLLGGAQDLAGRVEEDHRPVGPEALRGEDRGVLADVDA